MAEPRFLFEIVGGAQRRDMLAPLRITALDRLFTVYDSLDEARRAAAAMNGTNGPSKA